MGSRGCRRDWHEVCAFASKAQPEVAPRAARCCPHEHMALSPFTGGCLEGAEVGLYVPPPLGGASVESLYAIVEDAEHRPGSSRKIRGLWRGQQAPSRAREGGPAALVRRRRNDPSGMCHRHRRPMCATCGTFLRAWRSGRPAHPRALRRVFVGAVATLRLPRPCSAPRARPRALGRCATPEDPARARARARASSSPRRTSTR